ncbi:MAG TPA: hypothetical protein VHS28_10745, partial [Chloroflexota bacterium]|nr:hypothetical protein [Chloroflexota bacterium]
ATCRCRLWLSKSCREGQEVLVESRKVYVKSSVAPVLERAPKEVPVLLAQYLNLVDGCAQKLDIQIRLTEVAGCSDPGVECRQIAIIHTVRLPQIELRGYQHQLGIEIADWLHRLSPEQVKLVDEWFSLEVRSDLKGAEHGSA